MSKTTIGIIILVLLVIGGIGSAAQRQANQQNPLKIGFVGPLTGGPAIWGEGSRNMIQLATDEINAHGGIKGRPLIVTYEDGKCAGPDAVSATQKLLQQNIKFILGGHCSPETVAMAPLSKDGKFFMLAGVTSADSAVATSDYAFRTSPANKDITDRITPIASTKYKNIAVINEQTPFAKGFADDLIQGWQAAGGTIAAREEFPAGQTDFRTQLSKLKEKNAEALFISPQNPAAAVTLLKQMKELNFNVPIFGSSVLVAKDVYAKSQTPELWKDAFTIAPYADQNDAKVKELQVKYKDRFGKDVPYNFSYVGGVYDGTNILAKALIKCGEKPACVADYFRDVDYKGVTADYQFKDSGDSTFDQYAKVTIDASGQEVLDPVK